MTEKEVKGKLIAWSSCLKILLGPLDAQDHSLGNRVREISQGVDATLDRIEREGIKRS